MATITAKYRSSCGVCGQRITPGTQIEYTRGQPARHLDCTPVTLPDNVVHLSGGSGYGCQGWTVGETIPNPKAYTVQVTCQVCQHVQPYASRATFCDQAGCEGQA